MGSIEWFPLLPVSPRHSGSISVSYTRDSWYTYHFLQKVFYIFCRFYRIQLGKTQLDFVRLIVELLLKHETFTHAASCIDWKDRIAIQFLEYLIHTYHWSTLVTVIRNPLIISCNFIWLLCLAWVMIIKTKDIYSFNNINQIQFRRYFKLIPMWASCQNWIFKIGAFLLCYYSFAKIRLVLSKSKIYGTEWGSFVCWHKLSDILQT